MQIELVHPFPVYSLPKVWRWVQAHRDRIADDFWCADLDAFVDQWEALAAIGRQSWGVIRDGELGGAITSQKVGGIAWDLHVIFATHFYGHATTVTAIGQVLDQVFAPAPEGFGAEKISTEAFADNLALSGIVRALGGSKEGLKRGQTRRGGRLVDVQLLGLQKERFDVFRIRRVGQLDGSAIAPVEPLQSERIAERDDEPGAHAGAALGADATDADHPRAGNESGPVPGASQEQRP